MGRIHLILIGDELLSGKRQDSHLKRITADLTQSGARLETCETIRDEEGAVEAAVNRHLNGKRRERGYSDAEMMSLSCSCSRRAVGAEISLLTEYGPPTKQLTATQRGANKARRVSSDSPIGNRESCFGPS